MGCLLQDAGAAGGGRDLGRHRPLARSRRGSIAGVSPAAFVSSSTSASEALEVGDRGRHRHGRVARGLDEAGLHLGVGLEDLDELQVRLVVRVLGAGREDVHVRQRVRVGRVVLGDRVLEGEAGVLDEVVVDDRGGDIRQRRRRERGLERGDLHLGLRLVDVGEVGEDRAAALQLDEPGRLQHEQRAGLVRRVVGHGDGLAGLDVLDRVVLRSSRGPAGRSRSRRSARGPRRPRRCSRRGRRCAGTG